MCACVLWKRGIYLVGEEVRVARCVHGCYGGEDVIYICRGGG